MRIRRLELKAFGPFTNRILAFDSEKPGLHVIFGPNEAGKSSSLRALKALLYGFPERTTDNFLHAGNQLLICGTLERDDGAAICFQRRKKRKADILDMDGNPLDPDTLSPFLKGIELDIFENLYGIDHETLVRGGEDILAQKGEVGQALFAAGAGLSSLRQVIDNLEQEASELFKSSGKLPAINKAIAEYKELQRAFREATLSSRDWKSRRDAFYQAEAELAELEAQRVAKSTELRRLERLQRAIPELAALKNLQDQRNAVGNAIILPPDFSERYQQVSQAIREAKLQLGKDSERLKALEEKRNGSSFNKSLLDQSEVIDDFHQRLGEYRKGQKDRPERNGMRITLRKEAALLLKQVRPDVHIEEIEVLRPALSRKRTIQALSTRFESLDRELKQSARERSEAARELEEAAAHLETVPRIPDSAALMQTVRLAQKAGQIDEQLEQMQNETGEGTRICTAELKRLGRWQGELTGIIELGLPLPETVSHFENAYREIAETRRGLEKDEEKFQLELETVRTEIQKLTYGGEIPTEAELARAREKREQGWSLLRRQWISREDVETEGRNYDPERPLPDAYEENVRLADHVADRLRREVHRVAEHAALRAREGSLVERIARIGSQKAEHKEREKTLEKKWVGLWQQPGIDPLTPKEMSGWLSGVDRLRFRVGEILKKQQEADRHRKLQAELRQALIAALSAFSREQVPSGETLGPVLVYAEAVLHHIEKLKTEQERRSDRQAKAQKMLAAAEDRLSRAEAAMSEWQTEWQKALSQLMVKDFISPGEAVDLMEALQACFGKLKEADELQKRIDGIDRDAEQLEKEVRDLALKITPGMPSLLVDQAIVQLRDMLNQAQNQSTLYGEQTRGIDRLKREIAETARKLKSAEEHLAALLGIAGSERPDDLPEIINRSIECQRLQGRISDIEAALGRIGEGTSIEELTAQTALVNADELPGRIASLRDDIECRINAEIKRISQIIGEEKRELAAMDGGAKAAEAAERMEQQLTRIRRLSERYVRVKLASAILQKEIERYRNQHQDPVLKIAGRYFARMTLGSFAGLRTDADDNGRPLLVGIRPAGTRVPVEGMSSGTRDQLFLALRLATLEWRVAQNESIPFIVDDILINFDDERSKATLQALIDLSEKNQVILFTHHVKILEEARGLQKGEVNIHHLTPGRIIN